MANSAEEFENERIRSGYYLDIRNSLDICLQHYDGPGNPFYKVEIGARNYLDGMSNNENMSHSDKSAAAADSSSFAAESDLNCSASFDQLYSQQEQTFNAVNPCNEISGISALAQSTSGTTTRPDVETFLPDQIDHVLNELSSMELEEQAKLMSAVDQLLCHETMHVSSSSNSSKKNSAVPVVRSEAKAEVPRAQRRLKNKRSGKKTGGVDRTKSDFRWCKLYDAHGNAIPLAALENKTLAQMLQILKEYNSDRSASG